MAGKPRVFGQLIGLAVLRAARGVGREPGPDAGDRPPVHQAAVLPNAEGPGTPWRQPEEGSAAHASARPRGCLSEAIDQPPSPGHKFFRYVLRKMAITKPAAEPSTTCSSKGSGSRSSTRIFRRGYAGGWQAETSLRKCADFYHSERPHQGLGYRTALEGHRSRSDANRVRHGRFRAGRPASGPTCCSPRSTGCQPVPVMAGRQPALRKLRRR